MTLDEDFYNIQLIHGSPPKIIWFRTGNCSMASLARIVLDKIHLINSLIEDDSLDCLEIYS
ncbi:MAG: hypothetical protein KF852_03115 [Saprospiraceae bacterium]|nr:hypothetical protein [Saprospiraceae bacterium]